MCGGNLSIARSKAQQSANGPSGWASLGAPGDALAGGVAPGLNGACGWPTANGAQVGTGWGNDSRFDGLCGINPSSQALPGSLEAALNGLSGLGGLRAQLPFMAMPPPQQPSVSAATAAAMRLAGMPVMQDARSPVMSCGAQLSSGLQQSMPTSLSPNPMGSPMQGPLSGPGVLPACRWSGSSTTEQDVLSSWSSQDPSELVHMSSDSSAAAAAAMAAPAERPPPGCDPDAIKLFVGNIPKSLPEGQLHQLLSLVGKVVQLEIKRARFTHIAFVWYATREHAEQAILHFKAMRHVLPGLSEGQERPLVVRRAKLRPVKVPAHRQHEAAAAAAAAAAAGYSGLDFALLDAQTLFGDGAGDTEDGFTWVDCMQGRHGQGRVAAPSRQLSDLLGQGTIVDKEQARRCFSQDLQQPVMFGAQGRTSGYLFDTARPVAAPTSKPASPPAEVEDPNAEVTVSIPLTPAQLSNVSSHVRQMVVTVSGARIIIVPATAANQAQLQITGSSRQCSTAKNMVSSMMG